MNFIYSGTEITTIIDKKEVISDYYWHGNLVGQACWKCKENSLNLKNQIVINLDSSTMKHQGVLNYS